MNPKKSEQEKKAKKVNKEKKEETKEEKKEAPQKKSKLAELLDSNEDDKKEAKKAKIKSKKSKEQKHKKEYTLEFIMKLKDEKIANEELLLSKEVISHFDKFKKEKVEIKKLKTGEFDKTLNKLESRKSGKIDKKKEEEFRKLFDEALKDKNVDEKINYYLDKINQDNYEFVRKELVDLIKDNSELQEKFVDSVIKIGISKSPFCEIYAKLCKNIDKDLLSKKPKEENKEEEAKKEKNSIKISLIDKSRLLFTSEKFGEENKNEHKYIKENNFKKNMLGITHFLIELIKVHILTKKVVPSCLESLFTRYEKNKNDEILKSIYIEAIIIFVEQFEKIIHSQESKMEKKEVEEYTEKIEEIIKKLEQIKNEVKEKYLKHKIMNLIEKRKKDYQKSKFEIYLEEKLKHKPSVNNGGKKFNQDIINTRIQKGLNDYIIFVEKEGASDKYNWPDETFLIEKRGQGLDDILEAYFLSCGNIFEDDVKSTKNYIKELIEYYIGQKKENEKNDLKNRLIQIFDIVKNDIPIINEVYSHTLNMFLENKIMDIIDLDLISKEKELSKNELTVMDKIFKNLNEFSKQKSLKDELAKLTFVGKNKDLFKWLFE